MDEGRNRRGDVGSRRWGVGDGGTKRFEVCFAFVLGLAKRAVQNTTSCLTFPIVFVFRGSAVSIFFVVSVFFPFGFVSEYHV